MKTAADHQKKDLQEELHATIDAIIQAWPLIEHQARTMGGGYPSDTLAGGNNSSGHNDGMLQRTITMRQDLGQRSNHWLTELHELVTRARILRAGATRLLPLDEDEVEQARARKNTTEACAGCPEPIVDGEIKRIDGKPYHKNSCYFREWRARRGATMQPA